MNQKTLNQYEVEHLRDEILHLKNETINKCNSVLKKLEYPPVQLVLGTDIEYIFPYLVIANINLDYKAIEKYIANSSSHGFRHFLENYIEPIKSRWGNLICPLYNDKTLGIHNTYAFNTDCLNNLLEYLLIKYEQDFITYVNKFFTEILENSELKRHYGVSLNAEQLDINSNNKLKRETVINYLKLKNLL